MHYRIQTETTDAYFIILEIQLLNAIQITDVGETAALLGGHIYIILLISGGLFEGQA